MGLKIARACADGCLVQTDKQPDFCLGGLTSLNSLWVGSPGMLAVRCAEAGRRAGGNSVS